MSTHPVPVPPPAELEALARAAEARTGAAGWGHPPVLWEVNRVADGPATVDPVEVYDVPGVDLAAAIAGWTATDAGCCALVMVSEVRTAAAGRSAGPEDSHLRLAHLVAADGTEIVVCRHRGGAVVVLTGADADRLVRVEAVALRRMFSLPSGLDPSGLPDPAALHARVALAAVLRRVVADPEVEALEIVADHFTRSGEPPADWEDLRRSMVAEFEREAAAAAAAERAVDESVAQDRVRWLRWADGPLAAVYAVATQPQMAELEAELRALVASGRVSAVAADALAGRFGLSLTPGR